MPSRRAVLCASAGLALLVVAGLVPHAPPATGPVIAERPHPPRVQSLERLVRDFVSAIPRRETEAFDVPTAAEADAFTEAVAAARAGRLATARGLLEPLAYDLVEVEDAAGGRPLLVLRERRHRDGTWPHGWGLYVLSTRDPSSLLVQVPHPLFDINTPTLGVAAFRRAAAGTLFVAGTHRYANDDGTSDVAHREDSMFQHVTRALVEPETSVLQFHGFADESFPGYGDVVVSDGAAPPSAASAAVAGALRARGFDTCLYDGTACAGLGATTNVQGRWSRLVGADFVHVEVIRRLRDDRSRSRHLVQRTVDAILAPDRRPRPTDRRAD